ncbi:MAG: GH3 auxin-responsive promoter family protein [Bacteroidota bacterium]|nr:GH3 auxin-responsive promoter family protein [Bacteroidota bacterium]
MNQLYKAGANRVMGFYTIWLLRSLERIDGVKSQEETLKYLLGKAANTRFGKDHGFGRIKTIEDFQKAVPLRDYDAFWNEYWKNPFPEIENVSWPGRIPFFALTSGTATGATKYIPFTRELLKSNRKAALTLLGSYYLESKLKNLFKGHFFFLGGSTDLRDEGNGIFSGDLSGITASNSPAFLTSFTFPPKDLALIGNWEEKLAKLVDASKDMNITAISGVPSWVLLLFSELRKATGKEKISDIWPNLSLVINGGVKFDPYENTFRKQIGNEDVQFLETYPCSEGFIAFEDLRFHQLRLMLGHQIFYEFIPLEELGSNHPTRHTLAGIEKDLNYAIVVTTPAGLWSYVIGDTIIFESTDPPLLRFSGRTQYFLSAFGEHLISEEVEKAITYAAKMTRTTVNDFNVGPVFPDADMPTGHHLYLIEFEENPEELEVFSTHLDEQLKSLNEDYDAHRINDISISKPKIVGLKNGAYTAWMHAKGKLGGQHKVPRLDNSGKLTREINHWMSEHTYIL